MNQTAGHFFVWGKDEADVRNIVRVALDSLTIQPDSPMLAMVWPHASSRHHDHAG